MQLKKIWRIGKGLGITITKPAQEEIHRLILGDVMETIWLAAKNTKQRGKKFIQPEDIRVGYYTMRNNHAKNMIENMIGEIKRIHDGY